LVLVLKVLHSNRETECVMNDKEKTIQHIDELIRKYEGQKMEYSELVMQEEDPADLPDGAEYLGNFLSDLKTWKEELEKVC